jgi:hypothetical protein
MDIKYGVHRPLQLKQPDTLVRPCLDTPRELLHVHSYHWKDSSPIHFPVTILTYPRPYGAGSQRHQVPHGERVLVTWPNAC